MTNEILVAQTRFVEIGPDEHYLNVVVLITPTGKRFKMQVHTQAFSSLGLWVDCPIDWRK